MAADTSTREGWLTRGIELMEDLLVEAGAHLPERWMIGTMEPSKRTLGRAWPDQNDVHQMFVSVKMTDSIQVLGVALHEAIHISVGCEHGHRGPFAKVARAVGLAGKLTATYVDEGTELWDQLSKIVMKIGEFPNRELTPIPKSKGASKWIRLKSVNDDRYTVVISPKSLDGCGYPVDPWGDTMVEK